LSRAQRPVVVLESHPLEIVIHAFDGVQAGRINNPIDIQ
jgi:hypothetical protein